MIFQFLIINNNIILYIFSISINHYRYFNYLNYNIKYNSSTHEKYI